MNLDQLIGKLIKIMFLTADQALNDNIGKSINSSTSC